MWYSSSSGRIELQITMHQAEIGSHPGQCDADVLWLSQQPKIARQLTKIDRSDLVSELSGYGAWDDQELADHQQNLQRLLWLACCDIRENLS